MNTKVCLRHRCVLYRTLMILFHPVRYSLLVIKDCHIHGAIVVDLVGLGDVLIAIFVPHYSWISSQRQIICISIGLHRIILLYIWIVRRCKLTLRQLLDIWMFGLRICYFTLAIASDCWRNVGFLQ